MAYTKTTWEDLPSTNTPITASNLNNIENQVETNTDDIADVINGDKIMGSLVTTGIRSKNFINKYDFYGSNQSATTYKPIDTGIRATLGVVAENQWGIFRLPIELLGKTCTFSLTMSSSSTTKPLARIYYGNESNYVIQNAGFDLYDVGTKQATNTFLSSLPTNCTGIYMLLYGNRDGTGYSTGAYSDFTNLQLEEGSTKTSYADYFSPVDALANCTMATGTYTTASWATGTNTCTWTAPKTGYYLIFAKFQANDYSVAQPYKQLQIKGTATRIMGDMMFWQDVASNSFVEALVGCLPVYAVKGQTIIPYVHTDVAGKVWNMTITGLYLR